MEHAHPLGSRRHTIDSGLLELFLVVGIALATSFMCSIMEAVLLSMSHSFVAVLQRQGDRAGAMLAAMRAEIDEPIAAILTLNTIAHTVGAAMGGAIALEVFGNEWIALFSALLTLAVLLFSEIVPKTIGARYWKSLARPVAYLLRGLMFAMKPLTVPLSLINRLITPRGRKDPTVSRGELEVLAETGRREGTIDEHEWHVMSSVINLDRVKVSAIMTPRTRIIAVPLDAPIAVAKSIFLNEGHSRLPVYEESIDRIVGVVLARELWRAEREGAGGISAILRQPQFVPASKSVEDLLHELRDAQTKLAVVVDEFGGTAGIVTVHDILEEIVGELREEHDGGAAFRPIGPTETHIDGTVSLRELNRRLAVDIRGDDEYDTLGGFIQSGLGRIAKPGDVLEVTGGRFRVLEMEGRRIARVAFHAGGRKPRSPD